MRKLGMTLSVAGLALLGACSRGNDARSDDALKNDLALAAQAQPYQAQQFVSPMEAQYAPYGAQQYNAAARSPYYGAAPVYSRLPCTVPRRGRPLGAAAARRALTIRRRRVVSRSATPSATRRSVPRRVPSSAR